MQSEPLSQKTLKNSAYGFINFLWPIFFAIFITPIIVRKLGVADYGVYVLMLTIISFLNLLDLGFGTSFIKFLAEAYAKGDKEQEARLLNSAWFISIAIGFVGAGIMIILAKFAAPLFKITPDHYAQIVPVFYFAACSFFLLSISGIFTIIFQALQRFDLFTKVNVLSLSFLNLTILVVVLLDYKLKVVMGVYLLYTVIAFFIGFYFVKRLLIDIKFWPVPNWSVVKSVSKFGSFMFINNLANTALLQLDKLILGMYAGPALVSYYAVPGNVAAKNLGITSSLSGVLFPLMAGLTAIGETERIKNIYRRSIRNTILLAASIAVSITIFAKPILLFWLGGDFANHGTQVLYYLSWTYFFLAIYIPASYYLAGIGKVKLLAFSSVFMAIFNVLFMVLLIPKYSIVGAAIAYLLSVLVVPVTIYYIEKKYIKTTGSLNFYIKLIFKLGIVSLVVFVLSKLIFLPLTTNFYALLVFGPLTFITYLLLYYLFNFMEVEDRSIFVQYFTNLKIKIKNLVFKSTLL